MRNGAPILMGLAGLAMLGGCSSIKDHRGYLVDDALLGSVQAGVDNQTSVERTLGRPTFVSEFGRKDWYYLSTNTRQRAFGRARAYEQMLVKIRFDEKGNVAAVERSGIEKVARIDPDGDKTPTLGKERTFLEDLFGNIGTVDSAGAGGSGGGGDNTGG